MNLNLQTTLHLIADPLCGWCFGAEPLLRSSEALPGLNIQLHLGGLFSSPNNQTINQEMRRFISTHHERISQLSGQIPGKQFFDLLNSEAVVLDSSPPIRAILAAEKINADVLPYYHAIVDAHFMDGRRIAEEHTLREIAAESGMEMTSFQQSFDSLSAAQVDQHIRESRDLMQTVGGRGFPTFVLELDGQRQLLNHQSFYHDPLGWQETLRTLMNPQITH